MKGRIGLAGLAGILAVAALAPAGDWPMWGRDPSRNMIAPESGLADSFEPGIPKENSEEIDPATTRNIRWIARLGSQSYGNPVVAGGRAYVGTNNDHPRDKAHDGDRGVLMCFDDRTGGFLWQLVVPKLSAGKVVDFEACGVCSSPSVDGDRVYLVTNRCEVICLDAKGMADGNDGPFKDEGQYLAGPGQPAMKPGATDADILWVYNMYDDLGIFPSNMTSSAVLVLGDRVYATTSNSRDWTLKHIPSPDAPALICLDKNTGKLLGQEKSGISSRTFLSNWSSPASGKINGKDLIFFGGGDGWCYAFEPEPAADGTLKEVWRFNCNPEKHLISADGKPVPYGSDKGPSEVIATPVVHQNRVYVSVGQSPENGQGAGSLSCIDATKTGDISKAGLVWSSQQIGRSLSTVAVQDGLLFTADLAGFVYCFDAETGKMHWKHDSEGELWGSPLVADGKVYIGNAAGDVFILAASKEAKVIRRITLEGPVYSSAIVANGVIYIATENRLYAVKSK